MPTKKDTVRDLEPQKDPKGGQILPVGPPEDGGTIKLGDPGTIKKPNLPPPDGPTGNR